MSNPKDDPGKRLEILEAVIKEDRERWKANDERWRRNSDQLAGMIALLQEQGRRLEEQGRRQDEMIQELKKQGERTDAAMVVLHRLLEGR